MTKRILITGADGYLGQWTLMEIAGDSEYAVRLGVRSNPGVTTDSHRVLLDMRDWKSISSAVQGIDTVIHLAGSAQQYCETNPEECYSVNVTGARWLRYAAAEAGVQRIITVSTIQVFGIPMPSHIAPDTPPNPTGRYAEIHLAAENEFRDQQNPKVDIVRMSNGFGAPATSANCWHLAVNDFCRQAVLQGAIVLKSSGTTYRNFVPIRNSAKFLARLASSTNTPPNSVRTWVFGSPRAHTLQEMAVTVAERWHHISGTTVRINCPSSNSDKLIPAPTLDLKSALDIGYRPTHSFEEAIDTLLNSIANTDS
ncbi:MAG: NAD-dependent epimerase/dehydratase family protein [Actinomycetota bacterium]